MHCVKKITEDMFWVGVNDRRISLFENAFPVPHGISYNSYLLLDEKTVLLDTVDSSACHRFFDNLGYLLQDRPLDYLIVNHMEPDHCGTLGDLILRYPNVKIVGNAKTLTLIKQFFDFDAESRFLLIQEGDTLCVGKHTFTFLMAPMVHWPEVMVTYDTTDKILYSADAFGTFGTLDGNIFADQVNFETAFLDEARRYYANIVGKYGVQVIALLQKVSHLELQMICPLHGPVWRENLAWYIQKYQTWGSYTPEETGVVIAFGSIYGNTENAADALALKLADLGVKGIKMYDVSSTDPSYIVSECFRTSHIVLASSTYNGGIFSYMENLLHDLKAHNLQNRTVALIENGSWACQCGKLMTDLVSSMKNITILDNKVTLRSTLKTHQQEEIDALAQAIVSSLS